MPTSVIVLQQRGCSSKLPRSCLSYKPPLPPEVSAPFARLLDFNLSTGSLSGILEKTADALLAAQQVSGLLNLPYDLTSSAHERSNLGF